MSAKNKLVIVESPTKAKTIGNFLGDDYKVIASVGHIRDLIEPSQIETENKKGAYGRFGVDVDNGFKPSYVISTDKKKTVTELKRALKQADELWLATDEDREGEAIAWHLLEVLQPAVPVKRMVFHEITKDAINHAINNTRELKLPLVYAQETRRILDRLYGYDVSPVLWRKIGPKLSAGRVQSAATRLVVEKERERIAFKTASYWSLEAEFTPQNKQPFTAKLARIDGAKIATGTDFKDDGTLKTKAAATNTIQLDEQTAHSLKDALTKQTPTKPAHIVKVETKPHTRKPAAPFTTSTLQQEASRKLRYSSRQTMQIAQALYENGHITYMRTDSQTLSQQAIEAARTQARNLYGSETVPSTPRLYKAKSKGAQEAHEAIRPAGSTFKTPKQLENTLTKTQLALYELIWKRTVASQMADARGSTDTITVRAELTQPQTTTIQNQQTLLDFTASGTVITFPGFLLAYEEGRDEKRKDKHATDSTPLPQLHETEKVETSSIEAAAHETQPPARYTEASLTKRLEELGIGRPSTYAAIMTTIIDRGYVTKKGQALVPSWIAFSVVRLLEQHFAQLVSYDFTALLEQNLDEIAAGEQDRIKWLGEFYFGTKDHPGLRGVIDNLGEIDARQINTIQLDENISLRNGRYGPYLEVKDNKCETQEDGTLKPRLVNVPEELTPDELTPDRARQLAAETPQEDRIVGVNPATGRNIVAKKGRFGPYVTEILLDDEKLPTGQKPATASIFKTMNLETIDLETALKLLDLPRALGKHPDNNNEITAQNGRYGPYLKCGTETRSLQNEDQIFEITLQEAIEVLAQPKYGAKRAPAAAIKEFGEDPESGKTIKLKDGRFGPYVTDGVTNASVPKGEDPETLTTERAQELLAIRRAKGPATKRRTTTRKTTAKRKTTSTTRAKKKN